MGKFPLFSFAFLACLATSSLFAQVEPPMASPQAETPQPEAAQEAQKKVKTQRAAAPAPAKFESFTGKIAKGKVRLRVQPSYEGPVLRELNKGDLVVVTGETDDFFAVQPPADIHGFVFRTYILDNIVEADKVNVRLMPDRDATIIAQLKSGDRVEGTVAQANNKWLEISLPKTTRFYIAKDYIERAGDAGFKDRLDKKQQAATELLNTTNEMSRSEVQKPFEQCSIAGIQANYQHIINDYSEFPDITNKAKENSAALQKAYSDKKMAHLEEQSRLSSQAVAANRQLNAELEAHRTKIAELEHQIESNRYLSPMAQSADDAQAYQSRINRLPVNMAAWIPAEDSLFHAWTQATGSSNPQEFYNAQSQQGFMMHGVIDPYTRQVKNRPGDFLLLNAQSKLPIAFLYSTAVNLQDYVGHEVSVFVVPRENNNFAFPAYFVMKIE